MFWRLLSLYIFALVLTARASILRCDLIDPHSKESEICWKQLFYKNYLPVPQIVQENPAADNMPLPIHARNAELSSALMQLYGYNKFNGKRNPDFSRDMMRYMTDVNPYKEN